jgi:hypothetical protein
MSIAHSDAPDEREADSSDQLEADVIPLGGVITRDIIQSAMDLLTQRYGLVDRAQAFEIMRRVSSSATSSCAPSPPS